MSAWLTRSSFGRVIDALNDLGIRTRLTHNQTRTTCTCPAHEDLQPSLQVTETDETVLLHCFAGCHPSDVLAALGLRWADLYEDRPRSMMHEPPPRPPPEPKHPLFSADPEHLCRRIATQRRIYADPVYWRQRGDEFGGADCAAEAQVCRRYADRLTDADDDADEYLLAVEAGMAGQPWGPYPVLRRAGS